MKQKHIVVVAIIILISAISYKFFFTHKSSPDGKKQEIPPLLVRPQAPKDEHKHGHVHEHKDDKKEVAKKEKKVKLTKEEVRLNKVFKETNKHMKHVTVKIAEEYPDKKQTLIIVFNPDGTNYSAIINQRGYILRSWGKTITHKHNPNHQH